MLFLDKADGGERSEDRGTEDEMGADVASVWDRGRQTLLEMMLKSRVNPTDPQMKVSEVSTWVSMCSSCRFINTWKCEILF